MRLPVSPRGPATGTAVFAVLSCQGNCNEVLTSSEGIFTSPCYPSDYPPSQSCAWNLQAPAGFIVQITFLDFELEEAQGCIYDRVVIDNGSGTSNSFCGLTANGLTLNSTGNVMTVYFSSDFSVQKKGFSISYRQVAVALRNQKVTLPQNSKDVIKVTSTVSIPELSAFTVCFEIARLTQKGTETVFAYLDASKGVLLSFGATGSKMQLSIRGVKCFIDDLVTSVDFTSQMQLFCLTWSKTNGRIAVNFGGNYRVNTCSASVGLSLDPAGSFELGGGGGGGQNFNGIVYNFRLWDSAMTFSDLSALTCDAVGNVVDWDNSFWDIPASYAQTDPGLSCSTTLPYTTPQTTSCSSSGLGCPAPLTTTAPSTVTTNTIPTNATTNVQTTSSSTTPATTATTPTTPTTASTTTTEKERAVFLWSLLRLPQRSTTLSTTPLPSRPPVVPAGRSSKTSLGFISTPLIWPIRKKPETAITRAQKRPTVHLTKPPPFPTKSVTNVSPEPKPTSAENANLSTRRPTYSQVLWSHNQTDGLETFPVASLGNRKNKPLNKPPWVLSDDNKNSSETLDYSSGFGPEAFFYDIDLDDDVYSLYDFDSTYSLDESLATVIPLNISLLEMGSMPTASSSAPDDLSRTVSRQEHLQNQSESRSPLTVLAQIPDQAQTQSSWMLIPPLVPASGGASAQMDLSGLSRLNGKTTELPSFSVPALSPTCLVDSKLLSTVHQDLSEATGTEHSTMEFAQSQKGSTMVTSPLVKPTLVAHWQMGTLEDSYGRTMTTETVHKLTETIPVSTVAASPRGYLPSQTLLFAELLAVSHSPSQSSNPLIAEAHPTPFLHPTFATEAEPLMDSAHGSAVLIEALSSYTSTMLAAEVQSDYVMTETIRPSPLSLSAANDVSVALTPGPAESLFTSGAKDNSDLVLPPSKNQFIPTQSTYTYDSGRLVSPSLVVPYLGTEGMIMSSVAGQSKLDSPQAQEPSYVNGSLETPFRGSNRQNGDNSSEADLRGLSRTTHISVNSSSESPHTSAAALTDEWGRSPSSPLNSSSQMRAERMDGLPVFGLPSPSSVPVLAAWLGVSKATETGTFAGEELVPLSTFSVSVASVPSPSISYSGFLDSQRGPSVPWDAKESLSYVSDSKGHSETQQLSSMIRNESVFTLPQAFEGSITLSRIQTLPSVLDSTYRHSGTHEPKNTGAPHMLIREISDTPAHMDTNYHAIRPTGVFSHSRTYVPISLYATLSNTSPDRTMTLHPHVEGSSLISNPIPLSAATLTVSVAHLPGTGYEPEPVPYVTQSADGLHHASTSPSKQSWPSGLGASTQTSTPPFHSVDTNIPSNLQDPKYVQSPTTEQPFRSKNESAKPSSQGHNALAVRPATTDRETHPSPPAVDDQSFVPSNGTLPLATPLKEAIAGFETVPTGATRGTSTDSPELAPCPCKARFHITCLCGLSTGNKDTLYRITLRSQREITEETMANWFNQTFQGWTYTVKVYNISIQPGTDASGNRYTCKALLLYRNTTGKDLMSTEIETKLNSSSASGGLRLESVVVNVIENCPEQETLHYKWLETRPLDTKNISCFPYKEQNASRTCMISPDNYTSLWGQPDFSNCKDIEEIEVSSGNAAEVAVHLADITNNELSTAEVSQVVTVVKKLVNVARINATLATTVVTIFSNVMITSDSAQMAASGTALKTMDELVQKIEFDGPSLSITSKNLAVGISALNTSNFNGTSFSAFIPPNGTDPQIHFESEIQNPLAAVTLPSTLLNNLSAADIETISRINFMFFSKTGLFQDQQSNGLSLNSYVVASSVGNFTISNLRDPVQIEITHLHSLQENAKPQCVFWDFTLQNGSGGWNSEGCVVGSESSSNRTVCLCSHLTHFGVLMDISGAAAQIDERDTKILTFITYIGCGISAIFSAVTILTYIAFEKLRRDYPSKILMNLSTSLLFLNMVFLLDGWLASYNMEGLCVAVAVFLHFFLLTSFTWMGLESIHMYIALVKVFNTYIRRYILKFCIVGWGLPAVIVGIVVAVDKDSYGKEYYGKGENGQGSSEFCWIRSKAVFYVTCVAYFSIIFLMNVAMFIVVMMQICGRNGKRSNRTVREEVLRNLRSAVSLTFLLGMTWGFAFFAWGPVNLAFMYLFSIFNSLQGLFIFIFHCALKENVQKQWRRYLCCGKFRLADNSDWSKTATNNTKKVSSDNLGKSLSSSSFGSTTANWTSKAKTTLNPFAKRHSSAGELHISMISIT
ncbi:hypothetical protein AOLI_G00028680 [Acnodon oligacanthus]